MPKGSAWQEQHVAVTDATGTRLDTIIISCNGSFHSAQYFKPDQVGNEIIPDGTLSETNPAVACEEQAVLTWAVTNYPNRQP